MKRSEVPWETRFNELVKYEAKHGDCNVPSSQGTLGNWVRVQRKTYMANSLTQDRIDRLNSIDFNWALKGPTVPWETRFKELVQYKAKHGDCSSARDSLESGCKIKGLLTKGTSYRRTASTASMALALIGRRQ